MKKNLVGLKTRFSDLDQVVALNPDIVEFQFSDKDPDYPFHPKKSYDIPCIIHLPEFWNGYLIDISAITPENQVLPIRESRKILQEIITKSEKFFQYFTNQHNYFILHPGGMSFEKDYPENNVKRIQALIESLDMLNLHNSEVLIENLPPFPWYFNGQWNSNIFMNTEEMQQFCKKSGRSVCFDTSHAMLYCNEAKLDLISQWKTILPYTKHIHIADAIGVDQEGIQINEGEIDFPKFFKSLNTYEGAIINEVWMGYTNDFEGFKVATKRIKKYLI